MSQDLNTETLLAVPIKDDEIFELLERLAATEEMFKASVSTIRDVAELTDASPALIARLLGEMRKAGDFEQIADRLDEHDRRLKIVERSDEARVASPVYRNVIDLNDLVAPSRQKDDREIQVSYREKERSVERTAAIVFVAIIALVAFTFIVISSSGVK